MTATEDHLLGQITVYQYDFAGNLCYVYSYEKGDNVTLSNVKYRYDDQNRLAGEMYGYYYSSSDAIYRNYSYDDTTGNLKSLKFTFGLYGSITPTYDKIGKLTQKVTELRTGSLSSTIKLYKTETYRYLQTHYVETYVSEYVSQMGTSASDAAPDTTIYRYTYDKNGNITAISDGNDVVQNQYAYDHLGQLIREDNRALGYTYVYTYDNAGNRTSKKTYAFTLGDLGTVIDEITYNYSNDGWGDLLTEYGSDGEYYDELGDLMYGYRADAIYAYDKIGNPTRIYADPENYGFYTGYILKWDGRQLVEMCYGEGDESSLWPYGDTIYFTYNADGIRTHVQQLDWDTYYTVNGGQILEEQKQYCGTPYYTMLYIYDENGAPIGLKYNTTYYYFEKNLQGDIVGIYNEAGVKIGGYTYDAWGNFKIFYAEGISYTESEVISNNPFRYRGYYYDSYTGWYYLQTRYYDPEIGRFINADASAFLGVGDAFISYNLFVYCSNNPIMGYDPMGTWDWGKFWDVTVNVVAVIGGFFSGTYHAVETLVETGDMAEALIDGTISGIKTFGDINNTVNSVYYLFASATSTIEDPSDDTSAYVTDGYLSRWDRLSHAKAKTGQWYYNSTASAYYGEYSAHMYAWLATSWARDENIPLFSDIEKHSRYVDITPGKPDPKAWRVRIFEFFGRLGL